MAFWVVALALTGATLAFVLAPLARADASVGEPAQPRLALAIAGGVLLLAMATYLQVGDPASLRAGRSGDSARLPGDGPHADPAALVAELDAHLARHPADRRAWLILARLHFAAERFPQAAAAFDSALADDSPLARDAGLWCEYADALGMAQGGRLAGAPADAVRRALAIDAVQPKALELAGSVALEQGDDAAALAHWGALLEQLPTGSPKHRELLAAIERLEARSGLMRGGPSRR